MNKRSRLKQAQDILAQAQTVLKDCITFGQSTAYWDKISVQDLEAGILMLESAVVLCKAARDTQLEEDKIRAIKTSDSDAQRPKDAPG